MSNILPSPLLRTLREKYHIDERSFIEEHADSRQLTSVRLNPFKPIAVFDSEEPVAWCTAGRYLPSRPSFSTDPLFHAGCYYVQEASSMFLEQAVRHTVDLADSLRVLDLCAAPGGKSTHLASLLNAESLLVSNEIIKSRATVLADNMTRWGVLNNVVTNNDPKEVGRIASYFDLMVVDAPCSGSGMFRKDPHAIAEWSEANVGLCSQRQQRILADALPALKNGGVLIYSTCSYSDEENEQIADWLCSTYKLESLPVPLQSDWGIVETRSALHGCYGYRFYPHRIKGEGFFISCFRKREGGQANQPGRIKPVKADSLHINSIKQWLTAQPVDFLPLAEGYSLLPEGMLNEVRYLQQHLYLKQAGIFAGKVMGGKLVPSHELAQSLLVGTQVSRVELELEQALAYLRKEDIDVSQMPQGWVLMCYKSYALGWSKILPSRSNNHYPKNLRILKKADKPEL